MSDREVLRQVLQPPASGKRRPALCLEILREDKSLLLQGQDQVHQDEVLFAVGALDDLLAQLRPQQGNLRKGARRVTTLVAAL